MLIPPKRNRRKSGKATSDRYLTKQEQKAMDWYNARRDQKEIPLMLDRSDTNKRMMGK